MPGAPRASRRRYVLLLVVLTAVTLITLDSRNGRSGPLGALGRGAHTIVSPIESAIDSVTRPIGDWWHGVVDAGRLKRENRRLREALAAAQGKNLDAQQAITRDAQLQKLLGLDNLLLVKTVTGRIVGRDPGNFDSTLTIDRGTEHGIAVDMPVVSPDGLVGKVIQVWRGGAQVRVLADPAFAVGVQTPSHPHANATTGTATGDRNDLVVDDFDPSAKVLVGDRIVTSPLSTNLFPPDLRVGTVTSVVNEPGGIGMHVHIKPYVDFGGLEYLTVLLWVQGQGPVLRPTTTTSASTTTTTTPATTSSSTG